MYPSLPLLPLSVNPSLPIAQLSLDSFKFPTTLSTNGVVHSRPGRADEIWTDVSVLGHGAQGTVYLQELQSGPVRLLRAVKELLHDQRRARTGHVMRELDMMMAVRDHEELFVQLYGWFEDPRGVLFLAMEYVPHGDLAAYIKTTSAEQRDSREVTKQLLSGLSVLHSRHICHRDLKPQNVLLASLAPIKVKLADFGISKSTAGTDLRTRIGTTHYMAPELLGLLPSSLRLRNEYTTAVDMWALGFMVHELLTGRTPFLETPVESLSSGYPTVGMENVTTDMRLMLQFCDGQTGLLLESLQATDPDAIQFVRSLIAPDPRARATADQALCDPWISEQLPESEPQDDVPIVLAEPAWTPLQYHNRGFVDPTVPYNPGTDLRNDVKAVGSSLTAPDFRHHPFFLPTRAPHIVGGRPQFCGKSPLTPSPLTSWPRTPSPLIPSPPTPSIRAESGPPGSGAHDPPNGIEGWMRGTPGYQGPFSDIDTDALQDGPAKSAHDEMPMGRDSAKDSNECIRPDGSIGYWSD